MFQVYIPLNFGGCHWVCAQLDLPQWHLRIFDSQHSANTLERVMNFCRPLTIYIPHLLSATEFWTRRGMVPRTDDLTVSRVTGVPQQASGTGDCGPFVLAFIEYLSAGLDLQLSPTDGPLIRRRVAVQIWHGEML